jgi:hypothetical protein
MLISAHQPAYMPWAGYLHRIAISDKFVLLDEVQFEKNSFTNRNRIKTSNGVTWLTVPVSLKGHMTGTIRDVKIASGNNGLKKQWKTIQQAYAKSPYFKIHKFFFENVFIQEWQDLSLLNQTILDYLLIQFEIDTPLLFLSEMSIEGKKQDLILNICKVLGAEKFIFGGHGRDYVDTKHFKDAGVLPYFHEYNTLPYSQLWGEFEENLSVIDMLFNVHPDELRRQLFANGKIVTTGQV